MRIHHITEWVRRAWCALMDHPHEHTRDREAYADWLEGREPFAPGVYCSNCGAEIFGRRRGMHS